MADVSLSEIKVLLEQHMATSEQRDRLVVQAQAKTDARLQYTTEEVARLAKAMAVVQRDLGHTTDTARKALASQNELEGAVIRQVKVLERSIAEQAGSIVKLGANDTAQNAVLARLELAENTRQVQLDLLVKIAKLSPVFVGVATAILSVIMWLIHNAK